MHRSIRGRTLVLLLTLLLAVGTCLAGCARGSSGTGAGGKKKVTVWYLWGGKEGQVVADVIKRFNESQSKYEAVGLSVPDEQKIKVAIAGGNGPDVTDSFAQNVGKYAEEGISLPLDDLVKKDNFDLSDFVPSAIEQSKYKGKLYALPLNVMISGFYYNKKLLKDAGYSEPPKSSKEMLDMAIKTTKVGSGGAIEVLGYPAYPGFPFAEFMYAFGGQFLKDGKITIDTPASVAALQLNVDYISKFGLANIKQLQATGKWLDASDPFISGKQTFRIDGPWLSTYIKNLNPSLDYGITTIPYLEGNPGLAGSNYNTSSTFYIARTSKNVDGAWAFMKFLYSTPELAKVMGGMGNIPARISSMKDPMFNDMPDAQIFMKFGDSKNVKAFPNIPQFTDISNKAVKEEVDAVYDMKETPEEAVKSMQQKAEKLMN